MTALVLALVLGQAPYCPTGTCPAPAVAPVPIVGPTWGWHTLIVDGKRVLAWSYQRADGLYHYDPANLREVADAPAPDPGVRPAGDAPDPVDAGSAKGPDPDGGIVPDRVDDRPDPPQPEREPEPAVEPEPDPINFGLDLEALQAEAQGGELGAIQTNDPNLGVMLGAEPDQVGGIVDPTFNLTLPPISGQTWIGPAAVLGAAWVVAEAIKRRRSTTP
jgi:hypothetical protein